MVVVDLGRSEGTSSSKTRITFDKNSQTYEIKLVLASARSRFRSYILSSREAMVLGQR
jgi:hypothetical protein